MMRLAPVQSGRQPAVTRLAALAALDRVSLARLEVAVESAHLLKPREELLSEGSAVGEPQLIVSGWAARVRVLSDGRRQFLSFLLPGDLVGLCSQPRPLAVSTVAALTPLSVCIAPTADPGSPLADAYAASRALDEAYLLAQITRLGRLNAQERIGDLLLELYERLSLAGLAAHGAFELPMTQETLADALGLTPVHTNRMLQQARREGDLRLNSGRATLGDVAALTRKLGRTATRVSAADPG